MKKKLIANAPKLIQGATLGGATIGAQFGGPIGAAVGASVGAIGAGATILVVSLR